MDEVPEVMLVRFLDVELRFPELQYRIAHLVDLPLNVEISYLHAFHQCQCEIALEYLNDPRLHLSAFLLVTTDMD